MSKNRNNRREWTDDKVSTEDIGTTEELGLTGEETEDTLLDGVEETPVKEELETQTETQTELPVETKTTETKEELGEVSIEAGSLDDFYKALFRLENKNVNGIQELLNSLVLKDAADKLFID